MFADAYMTERLARERMQDILRDTEGGRRLHNAQFHAVSWRARLAAMVKGQAEDRHTPAGGC